jgi:hypothetical protein
MSYQLQATNCQLPVASYRKLETGNRKPITTHHLPLTDYLLPILLFLVFAPCSSAQVTQPVRYEKEQKNNYRDFTVISMGEQGIGLIRDKQKYEHGDNLWEVILLDSALNESWTKDLAVENRYRLIGHDYRDQNLYFLFRMGDTDQKNTTTNQNW